MTLHPYSCVFFLLLAALAAGARIESIRLADSHNYRVCDLETAGTAKLLKQTTSKHSIISRICGI